MSYCGKCGTEIGSHSKFCSSCGAAVQPAASVQRNDLASSDKRAFAAIGVVALLAIIWLVTPTAPSGESASAGSYTAGNLDESEAAAASAAETPTPSKNDERIPVTIRTIAGAREEQAFLVPPLRQPTADEINRAVEESGFPCRTGLGIHQLEQNGERMDVYKVDCSAGSYQLTEINGQARIKRWTGVMLGQ